MAFALSLMSSARCFRSAPVRAFNAYRPALDRAYGCAVSAWRRHYEPNPSGLHPVTPTRPLAPKTPMPREGGAERHNRRQREDGRLGVSIAAAGRIFPRKIASMHNPKETLW